MTSRMSRLRSLSPTEAAAQQNTRNKYIYAVPILLVSLVSFVVQTELSAYIQDDLGWNKAYCMMYFTHGSWVVLWPGLMLCMKLQKWNMPWKTYWERQVQLIRTTDIMIQTQKVDLTRSSGLPRKGVEDQWLKHLIRTTTYITLALTVAGISWYVAVDMTTPSDLTAIYNCNAFFAYVFSVPILKEKLRLDKSIAVGIAIAGVMVVVYGGEQEDEGDDTPESGTRFIGNVIIGVGAVLYGFYEVLYKRFACPPEGVSPHRSMVFAMAFASCIGFFTLTVLWVPLPFLHWSGLEPFEMPTGRTGFLVCISVLSNAIFSGSFLVLISLTSPVLSGVAALLTIFLVAIVDWLWKHKAFGLEALFGGGMIIVAFFMLSWSSYKEMAEHEKEKEVEIDFSDSGDDLESMLDGEEAREARR